MEQKKREPFQVEIKNSEAVGIPINEYCKLNFFIDWSTNDVIVEITNTFPLDNNLLVRDDKRQICLRLSTFEKIVKEVDARKDVVKLLFGKNT